jgi:DNA recombination protein RmuC
MPAAHIVALAIAASALTALVVALVMRRSMAIAAARLRETGAEPLRAAYAELERRLLLEEQKAARAAELEQGLAERVREVASLGEAKAAAEGQLATAAEALRRVEAAHRETQERLEGAEASLAEARREAGDLRSNLARVEETLNQERRLAEEKLALLTEAKAEMTREFKLMAQQIIEQQNDDFSRQSREQIENLLNPLADKLTEFESGLRAAHQESTEGRALLTEQIRQLTDTSERMTAETNSLVRALHGETQGPGAWGEMILTLLLERSGLREGEEYVIEARDGADEARNRSRDAVVNLPGGQRILIDAKVPLVAFEAYLGAVTEDDRAAQLSRHLVSLRRHIRALNTGERRPAVAGALDHVVMFVPVEGALAIALQHDANLTGYAAEQHVAIATPTTLMMALRTAANVWQVEHRNRNAEAIADRAGRIYDKFVEFLEDMDNVGHRLDQTRASYERAMNKLASGKGNLVRQVKRLGKLAPERAKRLPHDGSDLSAE